MKTKGIIVMVVSILTLCSTALYAQKTVIAKEQLPQTAQTFISTYFSAYTTNYIVQDKEYNSVEYNVHLANGMELEFDSKGEWKEIDGEYQAIPTGFISKKVVNYINSNYPNTQIFKVERNPFKQEVKLSNGLELEFNSSGDFVRID